MTRFNASPATQGGALYSAIVDFSGPSQRREPKAAICHASSAAATRLAGCRNCRRGSGVFGCGQRGAVRLRTDGGSSVLGPGSAVAAREVSRFARNSREWQQLVEMCRVVDTLLIDQEMVYSPRLSNDRLLLGLKGSLNEYELDLLRQRSLEARREKAKRGELVVAAPVGYLKTSDQCLQKDPDRRVQERRCWFFANFWRWERCGKRCCGFWRKRSCCRFARVTRRRSGSVLSTPPSIGS